MRYLKTVSFHANTSFNSEKDDREVNRILQVLQQHGARLLNVNMKLATTGTGACAVYVFDYEADEPLKT